MDALCSRARADQACEGCVGKRSLESHRLASSGLLLHQRRFGGVEVDAFQVCFASKQSKILSKRGHISKLSQ